MNRHSIFARVGGLLLALFILISVMPVHADTDNITVTFEVRGSKTIITAEDQDDALAVWIDETHEVPVGTTAFELTEQVLNRPEDGCQVTWRWHSFLTSITVPEQGTNTFQVTNGVGSYWSFYYVDGDELMMFEVGPDEYELQDGDHIVWQFENDPTYPFGVTQEDAAEPRDLVATPDEWTSFRGDAGNNGVRTLAYASQAAKQLAWQTRPGVVNDWGTSNNSELLLIDEHIYVVNDATLYQLDKTGDVVNEVELRASMGFMGRPVYDYGLLVVPLMGGALQAIDVATLETVWVADANQWAQFAPDSDEAGASWSEYRYDLQNLSTLTIHDGAVYAASVAFDESYTAIGGCVRMVDMATGQTPWQVLVDGGFYWGGAVIVDDQVYIAGEDQYLHVIDIATGEEPESEPLTAAAVRSTLVQADGALYLTSQDGHLFKVTRNEAGRLESANVAFAVSSTSTPAVHDGLAYVGGTKDESGAGVLAVIDIETMEVVAAYEAPAAIQSSPLVVVNDDGSVYVYVTVNDEHGALYVLADGALTAAFLPEGDAANYAMSSAIMGEDGTIYYTNDSGYLFALVD